MVGRLSECYLLAYGTPPESVRDLLPRGLELDTHDGQAFWNVVVSKVDRMRPMGVPRALGNSYVHVAYRLYAKARTREEGTLTGLCFVRSDVDHALMALVGDRMTDFRFHVADVSWREEDAGGALAVDVSGTKGGAGDARLRLDLHAKDAPALPPYLKYRPLGLSANVAGTKVRLAEVLRDEERWSEEPVRVAEARWGLFEKLGQHEARLVGATRVAPLDYRWRLGRSATLAGR